jgi:Zn-finger protein
MKQSCIQCGKIFYPTNKNFLGYPQGSYFEHKQEYKVFHSRSCMDRFLVKHEDVLIPIFKQIKESEDINNARTRENQAEREQAPSP